MKRMSYIKGVAVFFWIGMGYASGIKCTDEELKNHSIKQYNTLIDTFDRECSISLLSRFASRSQINACNRLSNMIEGVNAHLFNTFNAEQLRHNNSPTRESISYWRGR